MMRRLYICVLLLSALMSGGCAVHEWPAVEEPLTSEFVLRLKFSPEMTVWEHYYDIDTKELTPIENDTPSVYDNTQSSGVIRHIVRVYRYAESRSAMGRHLYEYMFTEDISDAGYDYETVLTLPHGAYTLMVWSDIVETQGDKHLYDVSDFAQAEISDHRVGSDYRDAFRGMQSLTLSGGNAERAVAEVYMHRPLAKFEIIAEGLEEFLEQEAVRGGTRHSLSDYQVVLAYTGYTPYAYNILTDAIVDSRYREIFMSSLTIIDDASASLGFDYVLVRDSDTLTRVQIGVLDADGEEVAMSEPVAIPLRRDHHTVVRGKFLLTHASGGFIGVDPSFDGDFNVIK